MSNGVFIRGLVFLIGYQVMVAIGFALYAVHCEPGAVGARRDTFGAPDEEVHRVPSFPLGATAGQWPRGDTR